MILGRIQAHPARSHLWGPLQDAIGLPTEVSVHSSDPPSPWAGYKQCLSEIPDCSHLVVVQDDAQVCRNFGATVTKIAERHPSTPVVLFLAKNPVRTARDAAKAIKHGQRYVTVFIREFLPMVGVLWPREKALEFMEWAETGKLPGGHGARSDDAVAGRWMIQTRQRVLATVPSIVQHPGMEPSVKGTANAATKWTALFFAEDGLEYEW